MILNVIPRDGGNTFSGQFIVNGANGAMQGSNYTQALKDRGLKAPSQLLKVYDVNPMGGGRIVRDKLWFYAYVRADWGRSTSPGHVVQQERRQPECLDGGFRQEPASVHRHDGANGIGRLTWQATPRNKINVHWSEQYTASSNKGGGTATQTIEATGRTLYQPSHIQQASWSSPVSGRLLLEAGWGMYQARYRNRSPRDRRQSLQPAHDPRDGTGRRDPGPDVPDAGRRAGPRLQQSPDRDAGEPGGRRSRMSPARTT